MSSLQVGWNGEGHLKHSRKLKQLKDKAPRRCLQQVNSVFIHAGRVPWPVHPLPAGEEQEWRGWALGQAAQGTTRGDHFSCSQFVSRQEHKFSEARFALILPSAASARAASSLWCAGGRMGSWLVPWGQDGAQLKVAAVLLALRRCRVHFPAVPPKSSSPPRSHACCLWSWQRVHKKTQVLWDKVNKAIHISFLRHTERRQRKITIRYFI